MGVRTAGRTGLAGRVLVVLLGGGAKALRRQRAANALAWIYAIGTVCALLLWLGYRLTRRDTVPQWLDFVFLLLNLPVGASLVSVAFMAVVTHGLVHRKRLALVLVLQLLGVLQAIGLLLWLTVFRDLWRPFDESTPPLLLSSWRSPSSWWSAR
ncbi:hypothetical protein [uncultured Propionibacterium sp.]|uniref:hypothetical protein n=1 Tax=uncultured Propionibacterium sp. TaxID=218066 RepID=UPI00292E26F9|nr:hypothetical protein [uncultured Propionibacterium sp.]